MVHDSPCCSCLCTQNMCSWIEQPKPRCWIIALPIAATQLEYRDIPKASKSLSPTTLSYGMLVILWIIKMIKVHSRRVSREPFTYCVIDSFLARIFDSTYAENSPQGRNRSPSDRFFDFVIKLLSRGFYKMNRWKQREELAYMLMLNLFGLTLF